jgi:ribosomal protein S18 acetylase RimI-like enzyme
MDIQLANQTHIPGLIRLLKQVGQVHHDIRPDIFPVGTQKYDEAQLASLLENGNRPIFVALEDNCVLGYCFCQMEDIPQTLSSVPRKELYIDDLCVDENCRGKGIATTLYRHVTDYARGQAVTHITLNVWCGNDQALRFYEKMGMQPRKIVMEQICLPLGEGGKNL